MEHPRADVRNADGVLVYRGVTVYRDEAGRVWFESPPCDRDGLAVEAGERLVILPAAADPIDVRVIWLMRELGRVGTVVNCTAA